MKELLGKLRGKSAQVGVVGLGYVGLPLARAFADAGYSVLGFDVDARKVEAIAEGRSYIDAVPTEVLGAHVASGKISATTEFVRAAECDAITICVPTPLTEHHDPDTSFIESTAESLAPHLVGETLVVLESTTYPGTTRELLAPLLGRGPEGGVYVGYSPERENPGDPRWSTARIPKVVGADDDASRALTAALYEGVVDGVVPVSSSDAAEASKLLENIYRCVNIALVNELKVCFERMGIDVFEVIEAAKTKPFGFQAFYPGPGLGGHCIPIDPFYLSWKAREHGVLTKFIDLAGEVNTHMPQYVVDRVMHALNDQRKPLNGSQVLMLGVAYKKNVDDVRESPALVLYELLRERGAEVRYHDPHVPHLGSGRRYAIDQDSVPLDPEVLQAADVVLIVTDHDQVDYAEVIRHASLVVDTRNATAAVRDGASHVVLA